MNPVDILQSAKRDYHAMGRHYLKRADDPVFGLGSVWAASSLLGSTRQWLDESQDAIDFIGRVQNKLFYTSYFPADKRLDVIPLNVDWQLARLPYNYFDEPEEIQEWEHTRSDFVVMRQGRRLSCYMLRLLAIAHSVGTAMPIKGSTILELGAGCGHQARYFLLKGCKKYVIVDLPETLAYSSCFLRLSFPNKKIVVAVDEADLEQDCDILLVPTIHLQGLYGREFDLFLNTASMGEMNNLIVRHYFDFFQNRAKFKFLYTLNRYLNFGDRPDENECSVLYDNRWKMLKWHLEPLFCRCPYVDSLHNRYVEILAERLPSPIPASEGERLLNEVMLEDWYRQGVNPYCHLDADLEMTGPLFKLWESIRIHPTAQAYEAMLKFLEVYNPGVTFEEEAYYRSRLQGDRPWFKKLLRVR